MSCSNSQSSKEDAMSIFQNLGLFFMRGNKLTVTGTAVKGIIRNAIVTINPLTKEGKCDVGNILVSSETDEEGFYSLNYYKTGGLICLTISAKPDSSSRIYDEKLKSDLTLSASDFNIVSILPESKFTQNAKKNTIASPFSNMLFKRFQFLVKESSPGTDISQLYRKASKELVVRFGLSSGLSSASRSLPVSSARAFSETDFPDLIDIPIDLSKPADPNTTKFIALMAGFSQLANQYKSGPQLSSADVNSVVNAFATDFEDGAFDGVGIDYKSISIGSGTNKVAFTNTPLTGLLLPAVINYIKEGGSLSVGSSTIEPPPTITIAQVASQIQPLDNAPIISSIPNPIIRRPLPVSDTGQVKCFWDNAGTWTEDTACSLTYTEGSPTNPKGQDALYSNIPQARNFIGPTAHSTFTNDYTTLDYVTGLVWKTCEEGKSGPLCASGSQTIMDQATALATCNTYNSSNSGSGYAGRKDWHLPTVQELSSVHNFNFVQAAQINTANFPGYTTFSHYWTASTYIITPTDAWVLGSNGGPYNAVKTDNATYKVRCVSGSLPTTQSFTDNTDGTVRDNFSGFIRQKCANGYNNDSTCTGSLVQTTWVNALNYCEGLTLAGRSDWRLPNIKELETLVDYSTSSLPKINSSLFPNAPIGYQWSSTSYIGGAPPQFAYFIDFNTGGTSFSSRGATMDARCVRGP